MIRALRFFLERWIQRGVFHQLVFVALTIVSIAVIGGLVAWVGTSSFESLGKAIWWAFLRLTDPGYLGDDEGALLRVVSVVITVLGYVVFMGSLIAILTQWLTSTMRKLESGRAPISMRDHVVVLGWTNRTAEIVDKLIRAQGRLQRFLATHEARSLRIVILADEVDAERRLALRHHLKDAWSQDVVTLRSGSSLQPEHLRGLDVSRAAVVIVPGSDFELGGAELTDARVVKTLLTLRQVIAADVPDESDGPSVVAEVFDPLKATIARSAMPEGLEVVASEAVVSRLISQSVRHRRLARVFFEILSHRSGSSIYVREIPQAVGHSPLALQRGLQGAVVIGLLRRGEHGSAASANAPAAILNPGPHVVVEEGDAIVFLAGCYDACAPVMERVTELPDRGEMPPRAKPTSDAHTILVFGWSYKIDSILVELGSSATERFEVTILSRIPASERDASLESAPYDRDRVRVHQVEGDYTTLAGLEAVGPDAFDSFVFVASAWMDSSEEADARTILGYVLLRSTLRPRPRPPEILVELLDPANSTLFPDSNDALLVSPRLTSHLLAHVALRPELNAVFDALFVAGGAEITLRSSDEYGVAHSEATFGVLQDRAYRRDEIALGVLLRRTRDNGERRVVLELTPSAEASWRFSDIDEIVVLADHLA